MDDIQAHKAKKKLKKMLSSKSWNMEGFHANSDIAVNAYVYGLAGAFEQKLTVSPSRIHLKP